MFCVCWPSILIGAVTSWILLITFGIVKQNFPVVKRCALVVNNFVILPVKEAALNSRLFRRFCISNENCESRSHCVSSQQHERDGSPSVAILAHRQKRGRSITVRRNNNSWTKIRIPNFYKNHFIFSIFDFCLFSDLRFLIISWRNSFQNPKLILFQNPKFSSRKFFQKFRICRFTTKLSRRRARVAEYFD